MIFHGYMNKCITEACKNILNNKLTLHFKRTMLKSENPNFLPHSKNLAAKISVSICEMDNNELSLKLYIQNII